MRTAALLAGLAALVAACVPEPAARVPEPRGHVTDRLTGAPVAGARVAVVGLAREAVTDEEGGYLLDVPVNASVRIEAAGYLAATTSDPDARLFPAEVDDASADRLLEGRQSGDSRLGDVRPAAMAALERPSGVKLAPGPLPDTIRVWRRGLDGSGDSCSGRVDWLPLEDYVAGVLPHEWIPSWDANALQMGAVAARTYGVWWVLAGGKYGCADLDDTTWSQVYTGERVDSTDAAVAATAGRVIVQDGAVVFAQYSAENGDPTYDGVPEPYCAGQPVYGHGHGICQWGTQRWGLYEGRDVDWMTGHYFPGASLSGASEPPPPPAEALAATWIEEGYPREMVSGEEGLAWLDYRNDGWATWSTDTTRIGATGPQDRESPFFHDGDWIYSNRPTAVDTETGWGQTGRFSFLVRAPWVAEPTFFVENFALVEESVQWFGPEQTFVAWGITVSPPVSESRAPDSGLMGGCMAVPATALMPLGLTRAALLILLARIVRRRKRVWRMIQLACRIPSWSSPESSSPPPSSSGEPSAPADPEDKT